MITINLLPQDLRKIERRPVLSSNVPYKIYIAGFVLLLIIVHFCFLSLALIKQVQVVSLRRGWNMIAPQSKETIGLKAEIKDMEAKIVSMNDVLSRRASITELLSSLNAAVPKGLWLERFSFVNDGLMIQGSVVSLTQNEMTIIGKFLQDIKSNKVFSTLFSKIELNSVQRRTIKTFDVVDFVVIGEKAGEKK